MEHALKSRVRRFKIEIEHVEAPNAEQQLRRAFNLILGGAARARDEAQIETTFTHAEGPDGE